MKERRNAIIVAVVVVIALVAVAGRFGHHDAASATATCVQHELSLQSAHYTSSGVKAALRAYPKPYHGPNRAAPGTDAIASAEAMCGVSRP